MGERESGLPLSRDADSSETESRDSESRETAATATRSHNVVHYVQRDLDHAARLLNSLAERSAGPESGPEVVVVLPTPDDALSLSQAVRSNRRNGSRALTPITSVQRGRRLLASGAKAIAASPAELAALIRESRLALSAVHTLALVWPEEILAGDQRDALETVMVEVPKASERIAVCAGRTPELAQFLERTMWRARTVDHVEATASTGPVIRVLTAVPAEQVRALRSVLDALDPETAVLVTFSDEGESAGREAASVLGGGELLSVSRGKPEGHFKLGIIFDDAPTAEDLDALRGAADDIVAIVRPTRLAALQKVAGNTAPFVWTGALASARSTQDALRDEIRGMAGSGAHLPWVPMLEPLLEQLDAVDVAGAALAMLDRERRRAKKVAPPPITQPVVADRPARESRPPAYGSKRPGGREESRGDRPSGGGGFRKPRPGAWGEGRGQGRRDEQRGPRRDAGDRPRRDEGRDRPPRRDEGRERPARRDDIERVPRAAREGREWSERGDRLRNSRRGGPRTRDDA